MLSIVCVIPYAIISRQAIAAHPAQGDLLITTDFTLVQGGEGANENDPEASTQLDEIAMQEAHEAADAMSRTTLAAMIAGLNVILRSKHTKAGEAAQEEMAASSSTGSRRSAQDDNTLVERVLGHPALNLGGQGEGEVRTIPP